ELVLHSEAVEETVIDTEAVLESDPSLSTEPEPLETAEFLLEHPGLAVWPEETPYSESWLELAAGPAMSEWSLQNGAAFTLSTADLVALNLLPRASSIEGHAFSSDLSPEAFTGSAPQRSLSATADTKKLANKNRLPSSGAIAIDIAPTAAAPAAEQSFVQAIR